MSNLWTPDVSNPGNTVSSLPPPTVNGDGPYCPPLPPLKAASAVEQFDWYVCELRRLLRTLDEAAAQWQVAQASGNRDAIAKATVAYQWAASAFVTFRSSQPFQFKVDAFSIDAKDPKTELGLARSFYVRVSRPDGFVGEAGGAGEVRSSTSSTYGHDVSGTMLSSEQSTSSVYGSSVYG